MAQIFPDGNTAQNAIWRRKGMVIYMKKAYLIIFAVLLLFTSCGTNMTKPDDTDLEFWITENVENVDFSGYEVRYGLMGGREYYGSGYVPTVDENGEQKDPDQCVIYTVTSYPDYSSGKSHITRIFISDPSVKVYGLTFNSSNDDIKTKMESSGFKLKQYENSYGLNYVKGKISIHFTEKSISIKAEVTNIFGIQF